MIGDDSAAINHLIPDGQWHLIVDGWYRTTAVVVAGRVCHLYVEREAIATITTLVTPMVRADGGTKCVNYQSTPKSQGRGGCHSKPPPLSSCLKKCVPPEAPQSINNRHWCLAIVSYHRPHASNSTFTSP